MIKLHHLNKSRSKRIIWLLEELGLDYQLVAYQRDSQTFLAPEALKNIHPLGKSPVLETANFTLAESGAITEYLISTYAGQKLMPEKDSVEYIEYLQWLHFAESSAALPLLLKMFVKMDGCQTNFMKGYADVETAKVIGYFNDCLMNKKYLVGDKLSGADIMMSFIVEMVSNSGELDKYPEIARYQQQLQSHSAYNKAQEIEQAHDTV